MMQNFFNFFFLKEAHVDDVKHPKMGRKMLFFFFSQLTSFLAIETAVGIKL
jgi:hypothetical protein